MVKYAMAVNVKRCVGCRTCVIACKMEHELPANVNRRQVLNDQNSPVFDKAQGIYPYVNQNWWPVQCMQCDNPPCVDVCPTEASLKREDGIVYVDESKCIACGYCEWSCPYEARQMDKENGVVEKCDFCMDRLDDNLDPMCVLCCPTRALTIGDIEDPNSEIYKVVNGKNAKTVKSEQGTGPNVYYY